MVYQNQPQEEEKKKDSAGVTTPLFSLSLSPSPSLSRSPSRACDIPALAISARPSYRKPLEYQRSLLTWGPFSAVSECPVTHRQSVW
jgi:hypothetical protein